MDESATLPVVVVEAADATDCGATTLHRIRQNKQTLRKIIRSRIKSAYPNNNDNTESSQLLSTQSNQVFSRLFDLPQYKHANSIGFFLSMPSGEIQTKHAVRKIVNDGKALYVPRVGLDFEMCDMELIRCDTWSAVDDEGGAMFYNDWPRNKWGIPEPPATTTNVAKPGDIDLLIVPGLAFDTNGHRLGQGKGYYDRFIAKMRDGENINNVHNDADEITAMRQQSESTPSKPLLVGVCLDEQFLPEIPHGVDFDDGCDCTNGIIPISDHDYIMDIVLTPSRTFILRNFC